MLAIDTLRRKNEMSKNGESIIDLTTRSFDFRGDVSVYRTAIVTEDFQMRPDLVARVEYGNSNKLDYICKFNGISNPFSLDMGKVLMIGNDDEMKTRKTTGNGSSMPINSARRIRRFSTFSNRSRSSRPMDRKKICRQTSLRPG